jgi:putative protease
MKLLTTLYDIKHMEDLISNFDGFIIGNDQFGARLTSSFSIDEINLAINYAKKQHKEIFLQANQMLDDNLIEALSMFIDRIDVNHLTGIIVGDLGAIMLLKSKNLADKAIYHPETLLTNSYDFNFLAKEGILGSFVAKEITLDDVLEIGKTKAMKLFMVGHGHLNMFYSKRQLIHNFMDFSEQDNIYHNKQNLKIIEEQRKEEPYPILEDKAGTHVFRSHVFSALNHLDDLEKVVDYLIIDSIFKDDKYAFQIGSLYKNKQKDEKIINEIQVQYNESWDEGFFNTKTIYKTKES